jgi:hypothetical protein
MKVFRTFGIVALALLICCGIAISQEPFTAGTWTRLTNAPPGGAGVAHAMLLSDGSVLAFNSSCATTGSAFRLVPDSTGSYINGTWVDAGTLPSGYNPLYFGSQVLPLGGYVTVMGGEYNACSAVWTNLGAYYNPKTNKWGTLAAPSGWTTIGDAQSIMLPTGNLMQANCCTTQEAIMTVSKGKPVWTATGTGKFDVNDEEGWTLLPTGNVLTVDAYVFQYDATGMNSELYTTSKGTWASAGSTGVQLWDSSADCGGEDSASYEVGPAVLQPNGTVLATGANRCAAGNNSIYNPTKGTWTPAPAFPNGDDIADGPGALLPDGNVLLDTSVGIYQTGSTFYEWDGTKFNTTSSPANAAVDSSYVGGFVELPTGQILFTDFSTTVEVYTPAGTACAGCAPTITSVKPTLTHGSVNNKISGTQFNGMSQGATYGDDNQMDTNWPIIRIVDSAGSVVYCKSHNWTPGVQTGSKVVSAEFDIPSTIATGSATIYVVVNGIPSTGTPVTID